jgi:hypothetical protein
MEVSIIAEKMLKECTKVYFWVFLFEKEEKRWVETQG